MSDDERRWYVVQVHSGFEKSVQRALQERIARSDIQHMFGQILVPIEEVVEIRGGRKTITERRFYPGYILVEMVIDEVSWYLVKRIPKVAGFVGGNASRPTPVSDREIAKILKQMTEGAEKPRPKVLFEVGEIVRIKEGPFTGFNGNVEGVNYDKSKLSVSVTIFGRATPVDLDFFQVEKV